MPKNLASSKKKYLLIIGDLIILYVSLWLTLIIRYGTTYDPSLWIQHLLPFSLVFVVWLIIFYIADLYEFSYRQSGITVMSKIIGSTAIAAVFAVIFFYFTTGRLFSIRPQRVLFIDVIIAFFLLYGWRLFFGRYSRSAKNASNVLIIGYNPLAREIIDHILNNPQLSLRIKGIIAGPTDYPLDRHQSLIIAGSAENLYQLCINDKIDIIVSTINPRENPSLLKNLFNCIPLRINFFDLLTFYEKITGKIPVTTIEQIWFLENLTDGKGNVYDKVKNIIDYLLSTILFIISLPFWPLIALAIKISSRGPVFFVQERVGKGGQNFKVIKFRTMVVGAEKNGPQWATANDARVTRLGRFLRKTRIDELPQLINIMRGEMSLIGPRPERPEFVEQLQNEIPFYKERLLVKPGLTGWAQVIGPAYGGSKEESLEKLQYDLYYIKNQSFGLDLSILLKTIRTIVSRRGH